VAAPTQLSGGLPSRLIGPTGEVQAVAGPDESRVVVGELDEGCPQWEVTLHRAKPWRAKARDGSVYRQRYVHDPRSESRSSF
jgi:deaminated glutathione amidase